MSASSRQAAGKRLSFLAGALSLAVVGHAQAASQRVDVTDATSVFTTVVSVPAGGATLETLDLSAGADTVLHVNDASSGAFVAGNDDVSPGVLRSSVTVGPGWYRVTVRSFSSDVVGTGTFQFSPVGGTPTTQPITFAGHQVWTGQDLVAGTLMQTADKTLGTTDTVLLAVPGNSATAVSVDDDGGAGTMSFFKTPGACSSCVVVVGTFDGLPSGATTLYIDEDAGNGRDADHDGVGDALEPAIGTSASNADTDGDGLSDAVEIYGVESWPVMKLPRWGANPLKPDVFVEADWLQGCDPNNPNLDLCQLPANWAAFNANYYAPDIALHIDNGVPNADPATQTLFGAWGGASAIPPFGSYCDGRADGFRRVFHHIILNGTTGGGGQTTGDGCSFASWNSFEHELGHQLGLGHGGGDGWNCKPHYRSPMNYAFSYDPAVTQFSRGERAAVVLNATGVNESVGVGSSDPAVYGYLSTSAFGFTTNSSGAVDWNRNGLFSSTLMPGAVQWPAGWTDCGLTWGGLNVAPSLSRAPDRSQLAWWHTPAGTNTLNLFYLDAATGGIDMQGIAQSELAKCRQSSPSTSCAAGFGTPTAVPGVSWPWLDSMAAVTFKNGTAMMLITYEGGTSLVYRIYQQWPITNFVGWSAASDVGSGPFNGAERPQAVEFPSGTVNVFSLAGTNIKRNQYNASSGTWDGNGSLMTWSDGTPISNDSGITPSFTRGYVQGNPSEQLFMVYMDISRTMWFARYDAPTDRWVKYDASIWQDYHASSSSPGLAYVPFDPALPSVGRFYLGYNPENGAQIAATETEGNDPSGSATTQRLLFRPNTMMINEWAFLEYGTDVAVSYNPSFDTNVRAAWGLVGNAQFWPIVDGITSLDLRDFNDYAIMLGNLPGSLVATWP